MGEFESSNTTHVDHTSTGEFVLSTTGECVLSHITHTDNTNTGTGEFVFYDGRIGIM